MRATRFVPEVPPAHERLSDIRTLKGGGAAGAATVGAAGIEMAEGVASETRGTLEPIMPYLDMLCGVDAALGIAVTIYARFNDRSRGRPGRVRAVPPLLPIADCNVFDGTGSWLGWDSLY